MNLNTFNISIIPCAVCSYPLSDRHHIWPQAKGGKTLPTIPLCPNHHRFANIVQAMLLKSLERHVIEAFAQQYFDSVFNSAMLDFLISEQERLSPFGWTAYREQREQDARTDPRRVVAAAGAFLREQRTRLERMRPDEPIPVADLQEAFAHIAAVMTALDLPDESVVLQ